MQMTMEALCWPPLAPLLSFQLPRRTPYPPRSGVMRSLLFQLNSSSLPRLSKCLCSGSTLVACTSPARFIYTEPVDGVLVEWRP